MRQLPARARTLVIASALAGAAVLAVRVPQMRGWRSQDLVAFAILAAAVVVTEQIVIRLGFGSERWDFTLTDVVIAGAILLVPASVLTAVVAVGILGGHLLRRVAPVKIAFNVGQFLVAVTAAELIFEGLRPVSVLEPGTWFAAGAAMLGFAAMNSASMAGIISAVGGEPFAKVVLPPLPANLLQAGTNAAIGVLGAIVYTLNPIGLPVMVLPLVAAYIAYRVWLEAARARRVAVPVEAAAAA